MSIEVFRVVLSCPIVKDCLHDIMVSCYPGYAEIWCGGASYDIVLWLVS